MFHAILSCWLTNLALVIMEDMSKESLRKGTISTVDLLVLTSSDPMLFILKTCFSYFQNNLS
jgi:hypothetical protein